MVVVAEELCMLMDLMVQAALVAAALVAYQMDLMVRRDQPIVVVAEAEQMVLSQTQLQVVDLVELEELQ
jgi:type II secretory pathway component HofQ